jgi:adenylate cyclase
MALNENAGTPAPAITVISRTCLSPASNQATNRNVIGPRGRQTLPFAMRGIEGDAMERKLAAIMAGDVVGYSRMMAEDESGTYNQLRAALDEIVRPALERHGGRVFKNTGDGFLASFPSVNEALDAAIDIQGGFAQRAMQLRIGLNLGDVIEEDGDVFGDGVNIAARLEALAEPGSIYVSAAVVRSADKNRSERFERIGRQQVKNLPEPIEVYVIRLQNAAAAAKAKRPPWRAPRWVAMTAAGVLAAVVAAGALTLDINWKTSIAEQLQGEPANTAGADTRPAVAVLPFDNMSGDPAQAYFSDGLTEDIITELARNRELSVIARNSTFAFRENATDIREIGDTLGVGYVVEGSARRSGNQLRVVAQLIDANAGTHLWSKSYDREVSDVFAVQTDLTAQIVASLVSYVRRAESDAAADRPTENLQAYDLVLRARDRYKQHGASDGGALLEARALYQRAIELDPNYADAHAYLGMTHIVDGVDNLTGQATARDLEIGLDEARQAIRLQPDLPLGYQTLSFGLAASGDYAGSIRAGERAVALNPGDPDSLMALAKAQVRFGAYAEAVGNAERARRLHPMAPHYYPYVHGQALYAADRIDEADEVLSECLLSAPQDPNCLRIRAAVKVRQGQMDEARATMAQLVAADSSFSLASETTYRRFGNSPLMEKYLSELAQAQAPKTADNRNRPASGAT